MRNTDKSIIISLSAIFGLMVLISFILGGNQLTDMSLVGRRNDNVCNILKLSGDEIDPEDNSTWGYSEWRAFIIMDYFNTTEDQLDPMIREDEIFQHNLHIITLASWGYYNGTYNEDDLTNLLNQIIHNTVKIEIVATPVHTDQEIWIDVELSINNDIFQFFFVLDIIIGFKSEEGGKWIPSPPQAYVWVEGLPFIPPKIDIYPLDINVPTVYSFRFKIITGSLEDNLNVIAVATAWIKIPTIPTFPMLPFPHDDVFVDLVDDDTDPPIVVLLEPPISPDYPEVRPVIKDCDPFLFIGLYCEDYSGIQKIVATLIHDEITYQYFGIYLSWSTYGIYVDNPGDLGEYSVKVEIYDADLDRGPIDQEITSFDLLFDVIDDDEDPPIVLIDTKTPYHQYYDPVRNKYTFPFNISAMDDGSGIYEFMYKIGPYSFNEHYSSEEYPTELFLQEELEFDPGMYLLEVWVQDADSDREGDSLITYTSRTIDLLAPWTFIYFYNEDYYDSSRGIHFIGPRTYIDLNGHDPDPDFTDDLIPAGVYATYYRFDDEETYKIYEGPFTLGGYSDGYHTIYFYSEDNVGNIEYTEKHYEFYLDKQHPYGYLHILFPPKYYDYIENIWYVTSESKFGFINIYDVLGPGGEKSGLRSIIYRIDDEDPILWNPSLGWFTLNGYAQGLHVISYAVVDNVGNAFHSSKRVFLDDISPITEAIIGNPKHIDEEGTIFVNDDTQITLIASDFGSGVKCTYYSIDGGLYNLYEGPISLMNYADGPHTIKFYSVDQLGNQESPRQLSVILDTINPETQIAFGEPYYDDNIGNHYLTSTTSISFISFDFGGSGTKSIHYRIDGGEFIEYFGSFTLDGYLEGMYTIEFYSIDNVENVEEPTKSKIVIIDDTPPITEAIIGNPKYIDEEGKTFINDDTPIILTALDFGSGVKFTYYSIDGSPYNLYEGSILFINHGEGPHSIEFYSIDRLGNQEDTPGKVTIVLDTILPETQIEIGEPYHDDSIGNHYLTSNSPISLTSFDFQGSGIKCINYRIDGGEYIEYSGSFTLVGSLEGTHIIEFYSIDNVENVEEPIKSKTVIIDNTPPETEIALDHYYIDGSGDIYVTLDTKFTLIGEDLGAKIANIYYQIDDGAFIEYFEPFTFQGFAEGSHIINFYSIDNVNNQESPPKSITVNIVSLEVNTFISDGEANPISHFDVIFAKDQLDGVTGFKLVATNPGQFFYHIRILNTWLITLDQVIVDVIVPEDFITQGTNPVIIYLDDIEITQECLISEAQISIFNIPPESKVEIIIHMDYALKGNFYENIDEFLLLNYDFNVIVQGSGVNPSDPSQILSGTNFDQTELIAHQKKTTALAGYIYDLDGNPVAGVTVLLKISDSIIKEATTDENGMYWFLNLEEGDFEIRLIKNGIPVTPWQSLTISKNLLNWLNFLIT